MPRRKEKVSTTAPWFLPGGQVVGLRMDLLEVLRAMDGRSPREIFAERKEATGADGNVKPKATSFDLWTPAEVEDVEDAGKTAIVNVVGPITQYEGVCDWMFGGTSLEQVMGDMEDAFADDEIGSIVMLVDSPGGEVAGIADAADRIQLMNATKPVVACITGDGCSAAYWLASAAGKIVASKTALLGSIGIVMTYVDETQAEEQAGVRRIEFVSSIAPKKRLDPSSDDGKAEIQAVVDEYGGIFVDAVASFRGVTAAKVRKDFGQGGVLIGASAVGAGLADKIGTLSDAIAAAQELAGAAGDSSTAEDPEGDPPPTNAGARARRGGLPVAENKKTADQLRADHPDAVGAIVEAAMQAERTRIAGLMKYNTAAYRAFAGKQIDAAIADGKTTAGDLAEIILDAQNAKLKKTAQAREDDSEELEEVLDESEVAPPDARDDKPNARAQQVRANLDPDKVYARLNGAQGGAK